MQYEFISKYLSSHGCKQISIRGEQLNCTCPFHNDTNPSFGINLNTGAWNCWVKCGASNHLWSLISKIEKCSKTQAQQYLQEIQENTLLTTQAVQNILLELYKEEPEYKFNKCLEELPNSIYDKDTDKLDYLYYCRNIFHYEKAARYYRIYYCNNPDSKYYEYIIFPIKDVDGKVCSFTTRLTNKYLSKAKVLHAIGGIKHLILGLYEAKQAGYKDIILVEGPIDMLKVWDSGFKNVVCTLNPHLSAGQVISILENFDKVYILFDNDDAGLAGSVKTFDTFNGIIPVKILTYNLPLGKDPGDLSSKKLADVINGKQYVMESIDDKKEELYKSTMKKLKRK